MHPSARDNLQEWIALGRKEPKYLQYATGGVGSPGHFAGALMQSQGKLSLVHVPYKGAGPAMTDVIGNQVPAVLGTLSGILPHIKSGKLKAIAITSAKRSPLLPDVPTIAESGFPATSRIRGSEYSCRAPRPMRSWRSSTRHPRGAQGPRGGGAHGKPGGLHHRRLARGAGRAGRREIKQFTQVVREQGLKPE